MNIGCKATKMPDEFKVHLYLLDNKFLSDVYLDHNAYKEVPIDLGALDGDLSPLDICEEVFDLTNNPCRQQERWLAYGRGRSVSVGDLVGVNGAFYLCKPIGWEAVTTPAWLEQTQEAQPDAPAM